MTDKKVLRKLRRAKAIANRWRRKAIKNEKRAKHFEEEARTDALTGLPNRRDFDERLEEEIARYHRTDRPFSVLIVDIDHFKRVNDIYGHDIGDLVLKKTADILNSSAGRGYDVIVRGRKEEVARRGGEEFIVLLPETNYDGAKTVAERIRKNVEGNVIDVGGEKINVTISGGMALYEGGTASDLLKTADRLLYTAKGSGRNKIGYLESEVVGENTNV